LVQHNGFGLDIFPQNNTKAGKRISKGQYVLLIVGETLKQVVGPSGLLVAIIGYPSFPVSVLVGGWEKSKRN
jgi:hypothetical protein